MKYQTSLQISLANFHISKFSKLFILLVSDVKLETPDPATYVFFTIVLLAWAVGITTRSAMFT